MAGDVTTRESMAEVATPHASGNGACESGATHVIGESSSADVSAAEAADMTAAEAAANTTTATRKGGTGSRRQSEQHGHGNRKNFSVHQVFHDLSPLFVRYPDLPALASRSVVDAAPDRAAASAHIPASGAYRSRRRMPGWRESQRPIGQRSFA
jgi:hypothetical protein